MAYGWWVLAVVAASVTVGAALCASPGDAASVACDMVAFTSSQTNLCRRYTPAASRPSYVQIVNLPSIAFPSSSGTIRAGFDVAVGWTGQYVGTAGSAQLERCG